MKKILLTLTFMLAFITSVSGQTCPPVAVPFLQSFSTGALPTCWVNQNPTSTSTNANVKWKFSGSAGYGATGNGGKPAGTFAWVDASSPYTDEHTVELITPQINLAGLTAPYVKFEWFKNHLDAAAGTLPTYDNNQLKVEVNDGAGWVQIFANDTNAPEWRTVGIPLASSYIGATIQLKFTVDKDVAGDGYFYDDVLLDEVQVIQAPTCFEPVTSPATNITPTSGTINWGPPAAPAPAPANGYEYYYTTTNTPPVAATVGTATAATSADLTPLVSGTTYYWWVRSVCSPTDKTPWVAGDPFTPGQIGSGTATHAYLPVYSCSGYNYSQQIYTAAEVNGAVGTNTYITSIKFFVSSTGSNQANYNQWVVYMGNTTQTDFATTTSWVPSSSLQQVYSGTLPAMTAGTWVTIPLATPFLWDGTSNIVVAVDENVTGTSCTANWGSYMAGTNRGILYYNSSTNPDPANPPTASNRYSTIPTLQLVGTTLQPCTTAPPANITVANITPTGATVSWTPSNGATYVLRYRALPSGAWTTVNITTPLTNSYNIPGLTESTQYEVEIATVCSGTTGAFSAGSTFTTPGVSYCTSNPTSTTAYEYISNVTVTPIGLPAMVSNSTVPPPFYSDYTTDATRLITLYRNTINNNLSVTKAYPNSTWSAATRVWIDFNRNGIFEASEMVMDDPSNTNTLVTSTFEVPAGAYAGTLPLRMRVILRESSSPDPCGTFTYGEVEDYAVRLIDLPACTTAPPTNITVTNLTPSSATISWAPTQGATYILRYRTGTGAWTTVNMTTPPVYVANLSGLLEQTTYEVQVATICGGTTGAFSASVNFTTPLISYCTSNPTSTTVYEYMSNVTVAPTGMPTMISNSPTPPPFYTDYTTDPARYITFIRGTANNSISVTKTYPNSTWSAATRAWVDFNRNGVFETSEIILDSPSNTTTLVNATFNVPTVAQGAYAGNLPLRMRVILKESSAPDPCGTFSYGEVEDYYVRLIDLLPCTTAAPSNITATNLTATTAYVSWLPAAGATYIIRWREGATGAWLPSAAGLTLPAGQSYHTITGLTEQTGYQVQVATICNGSTGAFSPSVSFTTPPLSYCNMTGTGTNDYISNVKVTPVNFPVMDNTSLQTNYTSYTTPATLINLEIGSTGNQLSVSKGWVNNTYSDAVYAYIDYNRDGIFTDSERIMTSAPSTTTPVTATFDVPATGVYLGPLTTTMRVVLKRTSAPVMCQDPVNGEVEDYAVRLRPCSNVTPGAPTFTLVTHNSATVNWTPATNNISYVLQYRPVTNPASAWTSVNASTLNGNPPVQLTGLTPATTYEVQIAAVCGGGPGAFTAIETFTTRCDPTPPNVTVSNVTPNSALVTWNPIVASATYTLRYRKVGTATWTEVPNLIPPVNSYTISGLDSFVTYEVQVASTCVGETTPNPWANPQVFTTVRICEIPPPGLTITQLTPTSAEVIWDPFPGATYILRYRKVGIPSWTNIPVNTNTYTITGLLELTKYEMQVVNICNGTPGNYTPPYYFTTPTVVYCQMSSASSANEFISKVTAKPNGKPEMINETQASNYSDFTGDPITFIEMVQGSSNNQIIIDKTLSSGADAGVAVWIDFNRNGYFDLNERILADGPNNNATASATFTVPADAFVSMTDYKYVVMRVAMQKDGIPVNCTNFADGEVEDYTVRISKQGVVNSVNQDDILIYPNPVKTVLNVKNISKKANYKIYSASGQLVSSGIILNNKIDVSRLINGLYVIDIDDVQGSVQKKFIKE